MYLDEIVRLAINDTQGMSIKHNLLAYADDLVFSHVDGFILAEFIEKFALLSKTFGLDLGYAKCALTGDPEQVRRV